MEALQSGPSSSHPLSPDSPMHQQQTHTECLDWDSGYLEYLRDARRGIELCSWACRDWSAPYDGENPSPNTAPPPPPPPTSNPSIAMFPEHFSLQQGGHSNTPPGQQRAAIVAAARSEWSSSERDSGEWDVTIGKNNCISLTPRSKKRSLQREELLPKPVPPLIPSSSSSATPLSSHSVSSPAPHIPSSAITVSYQAMYNGTMGQGDRCSDSRDRGLEVKKVKRDLSEQTYLDENANQNGSLLTCPSQSCTSAPQSIFSNSDIHDATSLCQKQIQPRGSIAQATSDAKPLDPHSAISHFAEDNQTQQSVERLIEELLEQSPGDPQLPGDSNGQGISIEAFTQELRELEDQVEERIRAACQQEEPATECVTAEQQEEQQQLSSCTAEAKLTGEAKGDVCSPARPLHQAASQPYTGQTWIVVSYRNCTTHTNVSLNEANCVHLTSTSCLENPANCVLQFHSLCAASPVLKKVSELSPLCVPTQAASSCLASPLHSCFIAQVRSSWFCLPSWRTCSKTPCTSTSCSRASWPSWPAIPSHSYAPSCSTPTWSSSPASSRWFRLTAPSDSEPLSQAFFLWAQVMRNSECTCF